MSDESRFLKQKSNKKTNWNKINPKLSYTKFEVQKRFRKCKFKSDNGKTKNGRTILLSKCAVCSSKKSRFMKK